MMMVEREILEALQKGVTAAVAASILPTLPVRYKGRIFGIPNDGKYLEIVHIPNNINGEFWNTGKTYRGLFRLILHWPVDDAGAYAPLDVIASIASHFSIGAVFQKNSVQVKVYQEPDLTGVIESAPDQLFPVTIRYESFQP
ncbi:hypothetical protein P106B_27 [Rhizobium phage vB_RglS_P106B]|uniref:Uncharacterized protein n=1 Tax=Rhizobium phage vB_RglS_P106B TaxID=1458697 RepID=W6E8F2_9CAUD|nr:tail terminator [Rhizobium phage vB_RglS_P106B]AHJ10710.1 hypothetical protein P106B_27 [Rhizobium phage vB_RglS_P106B]